MIPFAGIFFSFTNAGRSLHNSHTVARSDETDTSTVGAALWAADIEAKNTAMTKTTAPNLQETARQAE